MTVENSLNWLMRWYHDQCDGEWEHGAGIQITTLDNPGWSLEISLKDTPLDGRELPQVSHNEGHRTDWWTCWTEGNVFRGAGGSLQLGAMIDTFREWAERKSAE